MYVTFSSISPFFVVVIFIIGECFVGREREKNELLIVRERKAKRGEGRKRRRRHNCNNRTTIKQTKDKLTNNNKTNII
jgi:hypothetical protein